MTQESELEDDPYDTRIPRQGAGRRPPSGETVDLQRLWLGTLCHQWRTLAVVPVDAGVSTYDVASLIATLGTNHGDAVSLADLRDIRLNRVGAFLEAAGELVSRGQRVIFATSSISENLAAIPLARAAERVILCVSLGSTPLRLIEETIEQVGKERFLGSMLLRAAPASVESFLVAPKRLRAQS